MHKNTSGFTIVELLVVIAVIGILSTISVLSFNHFQANSRDSQRSSSVVIIAEALEKYYDANGEYPSCNSMTSAGNSVASILGGVDQKALVAPRAIAAKTNSIDFCTSLAPGVTTDSFAYVGDGSAECTTTSCLSYTLQYKEEATGPYRCSWRNNQRRIIGQWDNTRLCWRSCVHVNRFWGNFDKPLAEHFGRLVWQYLIAERKYTGG